MSIDSSSAVTFTKCRLGPPGETQRLSTEFNFQNRPGFHTIKSPVVDSRAKELLAVKLNFQNRPGFHTIKSPVVGSRAKELLAVKQAIKSEKVLSQLQEAVYKDVFIYLIPAKEKDKADEIAKELFLNYISKYAPYGCTEENIVDWAKTGMPGAASNVTRIYDTENEWNTWRVCASVEARNGKFNEKYDRYLPPHIVAYHELMHVEEIAPQAKSETQGENGVELLTAIKTIINLDEVYKKIHGLKETDEVDYDKTIDINGIKINLGRFANFYREQEARFGKLYLALNSKESIDFLKGKPESSLEFIDPLKGKPSSMSKSSLESIDFLKGKPESSLEFIDPLKGKPSSKSESSLGSIVYS